MSKVWIVLRHLLFVLAFIAIIGWPSISVLIDGKTNSVKPWIYLTFGALSLNIPIWITISQFFNMNQNPQTKLIVFIIGTSALVTVVSGFCLTKLLAAFITEDIEYLGKIIYILISGSVQLFSSLVVLFMSMLLLLDNKIGASLSEKYTVTFFTCLLSTVVAVCAFYIFNAVSGNSDIKLVLLISLLGLTLFLFFWIVMICGTFGAMGDSSIEWAGAAGIIYNLAYFPFFGYWTINALQILYLNRAETAINGNPMIFFAYIAIFCTLIPGLLVLILLALFLIVGMFLLFIYAIMRIFCPGSLNSFIHHPQPPPNNLDEESLYGLAMPLQINLEAENFDLRKHTKSFVQEEVCSVCLDGFEEGQLVTYWPICKHIFHRACLEYWIKKNQTCPICKQYYPNAIPMQGDQDLPLEEEISD